MENCKACHVPIPEASNFCPRCGAKQVHQRLTLWALLNTLVNRFVKFDFPFYTTSLWLILKPEAVTNGYINGLRKVINPPIQYAFVALSMYGLFQYIFSDFLELADQQNFLSGFQEGFNNYETPHEERYEHVNNTVAWLQTRNQLLIFTVVPFIGLFAAALYRKRGYNLAEHFVIAIYAVSFTLVLSVLLGLIMALIGTEAATDFYISSSNILNPIVITWVYYRSLKGNVLKPVFILLLSFVTMMLLLFLILVPYMIYEATR